MYYTQLHFFTITLNWKLLCTFSISNHYSSFAKALLTWLPAFTSFLSDDILNGRCQFPKDQ